jgi:hypothetical protein
MKYALSIFILMLTISVGYGQNKKMIEKANEKVEELNQWIVAANPDLALTEDQKEKVRDLHIQKLIDVKAINQSDLPDEEKEIKRKEVFKNVGKTIHNEILTSEQRKAKKEGKDKLEGEE